MKEMSNVVKGVMWLAQCGASRESVIESLLYSFPSREIAEAALAEMADAGHIMDDGVKIRIPKTKGL